MLQRLCSLKEGRMTIGNNRIKRIVPLITGSRDPVDW
jgi:hypothetical protein